MQIKENFSSSIAFENEHSVLPITQEINDISNSNKNNLNINENSYNLANEFYNNNKSITSSVNESIKHENLELFIKIYRENTVIFMKSFFDLPLLKLNCDQAKNDFSFLLHVLANKNLYDFTKFIFYESKIYLENYFKNENFIFTDNNDPSSKKGSYSNANNYFDNFINRIDNQGFAPIHYAIKSGNIKLINLFLDYQADVTRRTNNGFSCLHIAASLYKLELFIYLYEKNSDILSLEDTDFEENSLLHIACFYGSTDIFEYLIYKNVNLNKKDKKGNTPLHYAVFSGKINKLFIFIYNSFIGNKKIVKKLLIIGGDLQITNNRGESPYEYSIKYNHEKIKSLFDEYIKERRNTICIFRPGLRKPEKTTFNFYFFIIMHILVESLIYLLILPCNIKSNKFL